MAETQGTVTASQVNIRSGPGLDFSILTVLPKGSAVDVLADQGDWLQVRFNGAVGFANKNFVFVPHTSPPSGFLHDRDALLTIPLAVPPAQQLRPGPVASPAQRQVASTWNNSGGLLGALSTEIEIEPGASVAVLCVESGGNFFGPDGRLIIRFENHVFWRRWGQKTAATQAVFQQHFRFDAEQKWQGHEYRVDIADAWRPVHLNQETEWQAFILARTLDETQGLCAISMGAPQIMGFNYAAVGYQSVQEMFAAFSGNPSGAREQILALFDFIKGPGDSSPMLTALQAKDFVAFAQGYNGPGNATMYGARIERYRDIFVQLAG